MYKYKTVKIPEESYKKAKSLSRELEKSDEFLGAHKVNLSSTISYAIARTLNAVKKKKILMSAARGWSDMDTENLIRDIYDSRTVSTRGEVRI